MIIRIPKEDRVHILKNILFVTTFLVHASLSFGSDFSNNHDLGILYDDFFQFVGKVSLPNQYHKDNKAQSRKCLSSRNALQSKIDSFGNLELLSYIGSPIDTFETWDKIQDDLLDVPSYGSNLKNCNKNPLSTFDLPNYCEYRTRERVEKTIICDCYEKLKEDGRIFSPNCKTYRCNEGDKYYQPMELQTLGVSKKDRLTIESLQTYQKIYDCGGDADVPYSFDDYYKKEFLPCEEVIKKSKERVKKLMHPERLLEKTPELVNLKKALPSLKPLILKVEKDCYYDSPKADYLDDLLYKVTYKIGPDDFLCKNTIKKYPEFNLNSFKRIGVGILGNEITRGKKNTSKRFIKKHRPWSKVNNFHDEHKKLTNVNFYPEDNSIDSIIWNKRLTQVESRAGILKMSSDVIKSRRFKEIAMACDAENFSDHFDIDQRVAESVCKNVCSYHVLGYCWEYAKKPYFCDRLGEVESPRRQQQRPTNNSNENKSPGSDGRKSKYN